MKVAVPIPHEETRRGGKLRQCPLCPHQRPQHYSELCGMRAGGHMHARVSCVCSVLRSAVSIVESERFAGLVMAVLVVLGEGGALVVGGRKCATRSPAGCSLSDGAQAGGTAAFAITSAGTSRYPWYRCGRGWAELEVRGRCGGRRGHGESAAEACLATAMPGMFAGMFAGHDHGGAYVGVGGKF